MRYPVVGHHTITAQYLGSPGYAASSVSPAITQLVIQAATSTAVISTTGSRGLGGQGRDLRRERLGGAARFRHAGRWPRRVLRRGGADLWMRGDLRGTGALLGESHLHRHVSSRRVALRSPREYLGSTDFAPSEVSPAFTQLVTPARPPGYYLEGGDGGVPRRVAPVLVNVTGFVVTCVVGATNHGSTAENSTVKKAICNTHEDFSRRIAFPGVR